MISEYQVSRKPEFLHSYALPQTDRSIAYLSDTLHSAPKENAKAAYHRNRSGTTCPYADLHHAPRNQIHPLPFPAPNRTETQLSNDDKKRRNMSINPATYADSAPTSFHETTAYPRPLYQPTMGFSDPEESFQNQS